MNDDCPHCDCEPTGYTVEITGVQDNDYAGLPECVLDSIIDDICRREGIEPTRIIISPDDGSRTYINPESGERVEFRGAALN